MFSLNSAKHLESDRVFAPVSGHIDFSLLASFPFLSSVRTASVPVIFAYPFKSFRRTSHRVFVSHRSASAPLKSSCQIRTCLFKSFRFFRSDLLDLSRFNSSKLFISKLVGSPQQVKAFRVFLGSFRPFSSTTVIRFFSDRVLASVCITSITLASNPVASTNHICSTLQTSSIQPFHQLKIDSSIQVK